jgi:small subunit ribosomal protein S7
MKKDYLIQKTSINHYKHLLQYILKKGKKNTLENHFKKGVFFWMKNIPEKNFKTTLTNAFLNTTPYVSVKTKRKGSKNIYLPLKITKKRGKYLSAKWLLTNSFAKQKRNFCEGIVEELIDSSLKKSLSVKKRDELHKLADESLVNLK